MSSTYEKIATTTLGSAQATVTFSTITGTYTDLVLVIGNLKVSTNTSSLTLQLNGDTGSNYSNTQLIGNGSAASSRRGSSLTSALNYITYGAASNTSEGVVILNFQNYSNATTYKTTLIRANSAPNSVEATVNLWRNTAAITSITMGMQGSDTYSSGSTFTLYGIKAE
jgi:hypothetical protein